MSITSTKLWPQYGQGMVSLTSTFSCVRDNVHAWNQNFKCVFLEWLLLNRLRPRLGLAQRSRRGVDGKASPS
jgi:hypothetical protein